MFSYMPSTLLERAVLESGRFALASDTAGREVLAVGQRRLPRVVLQQKADGLHGLMQQVAASGGRVFTVARDDPWLIEEAAEEVDDCASPVAAEEYLVMGLRPLTVAGRPVRVAVRREVVRLLLLPWTVPAVSLQFGTSRHFVVTGTRGVVGDWQLTADGRSGVVVGVPELWVGILERLHPAGSGLVLRCDVPVPWVGDDGLCGATPTAIGVFSRRDGDGDGTDGDDHLLGESGESWLARLPVVMTEGDVVQPVPVPDGVAVGTVPEGPWEREAEGPADFPMSSLT